MTTSGTLAHLYRRAGFGATAAEIESAAALGYSAGVKALVAGLGGPDQGADAVPLPALTPLTTDFIAQLGNAATRAQAQKVLATDRKDLVNWWLARMLATTNPLQEKLTLLLHGHFPTAISKVRYPTLMYRQNELFRTQGAGDFDTLMKAVSVDPAMLIWLDASSDKATSPNENFARELMERFTMGIGTYTENDVRAAAICFTGWQLNLVTGQFSISPKNHDNTPQTVLGVPGVNSGQQVIDIATHSGASSKYVPAAFWSHLAYPVSTRDKVVADLAAIYAPDRNVGALLEAIFDHPAFGSATAKSGLVKQPVEYVVGALRALGMTKPEALTTLPVQAVLGELGQVLFDPPSVGGWPQNEYWLSTAAALTRWQFAHQLVAKADLSSVTDEAARARVDAVGHLLGIPSWQPVTAETLKKSAGDPETLTVLALVSPEFVTN